MNNCERCLKVVHSLSNPITIISSIMTALDNFPLKAIQKCKASPCIAFVAWEAIGAVSSSLLICEKGSASLSKECTL